MNTSQDVAPLSAVAWEEFLFSTAHKVGVVAHDNVIKIAYVVRPCTRIYTYACSGM